MHHLMFVKCYSGKHNFLYTTNSSIQFKDRFYCDPRL